MARRADSGRNKGLDALRAGAALSVVGFHYFSNAGGYFPSGRLAAWLFHDGWAAVNVFFVLSGYLVSQPLLDRALSVRAFYARRIARTGPLFLALVAVTMPVVVIFGTMGGLMSMSWSLLVEEQFYLVLPAAIYFLPAKVLPPTLITAAILAPLIRFGSVGMIEPEVGRWLLPYNMDSLALGVLLAMAMRQPGFKPWLECHRSWLVVAMSLFVVVLFLVPGDGPLAYEMFNLAALLTVLWGATTEMSFPAAIGWIGQRSYPIYLFQHFAVLLIVPLAEGWFGGVLTIAVLLGISALLHTTIESPIHQWARERFRNQDMALARA